MTTAPLQVPPRVKPLDGASPNTRHGLQGVAIALWIVWAVLVAVELSLVLPRTPIVLVVVASLWFALPGVPFVWRLLGSSRAALTTAWYVGPALGLGFSTFGLLLWWVAGLQNGLAILLAPLLTYALAVIAKRFGGVALRLPNSNCAITRPSPPCC